MLHTEFEIFIKHVLDLVLKLNRQFNNPESTDYNN
jgi:hypothetical protein